MAVDGTEVTVLVAVRGERDSVAACNCLSRFGIKMQGDPACLVHSSIPATMLASVLDLLFRLSQSKAKGGWLVWHHEFEGRGLLDRSVPLSTRV